MFFRACALIHKYLVECINAIFYLFLFCSKDDPIYIFIIYILLSIIVYSFKYFAPLLCVACTHFEMKKEKLNGSICYSV